MHSVPNRRNSNFQQAYFLAGSCHTADGAYALLRSQEEERETTLAVSKAEALRTQAKIVRAHEKFNSSDPAERLEGEADLLEVEAFRTMTERNVAGAESELAFIRKLIDHLQPHRKHAHLPDPEAHEAAQAEEWRLELIHRAENHLLTSGQVPHSELATMRMHPAFETSIFPAVLEMQKMIHHSATTGKPLPVPTKTPLIELEYRDGQLLPG